MMTSKSFSLDANELESMFDMLQSFSISKDPFDNIKLASLSRDNLLHTESIDLDPLFSFMSTDEFQNSICYNKENEYRNNNNNNNSCSTVFYQPAPYISPPKFMRPPIHNGNTNNNYMSTLQGSNNSKNSHMNQMYNPNSNDVISNECQSPPSNSYPMISLFSLYNLTRGITEEKSESTKEKKNKNKDKKSVKLFSNKYNQEEKPKKNDNSNKEDKLKISKIKKEDDDKAEDKQVEIKSDYKSETPKDKLKKFKAKKAKKPESPKRVGIYTLEERKVKIALYRKKRADRKSLLKYKYRRDLAEKRQRIGGRFVKVEKPPLPTVVEEENEVEKTPKEDEKNDEE